MLLERINKYIKQIDVVDDFNAASDMSIEDLVEYIKTSENGYDILSLLDNERRNQIEKLIEGGVL